MSSYTLPHASDPALLRSRTTVTFSLMNIFPTSLLFDKVLGYLSMLTGVLMVLFNLVGALILLPSILVVDFVKKSDRNISTSVRGSRTAIKAACARSQMFLQQSGGPDFLAPSLARQLSLFGEGIPGSHLWTRIYLFLSRCNFYLTGRIFPDQLGSRITKCGETAFLQARTCWLDDCVETFVRKHQDLDTGKADVNVVILGAGYDTRCYRLGLPERGVQTFEVDTPSTQQAKIKALSNAGINASKTKFVTCDFTSEDWLDRLQMNGFSMKIPTLFVWEGMTMYLPRDAVKTTIEKLGRCAKGSCIGFDYLDRTWALTPDIQKIMKRWGEPWLFGMTGDEPEELIAECASDCKRDETILEHLKYKEVIRRYLAKHCDGRPIGFLDDFGGFILVGTD